MKKVYFLLLALFIFLSGCVTKVSGAKIGLSPVLEADRKEVEINTPVFFTARIDNQCSEDAKNLVVSLENLTGWVVENKYKSIKEIGSGESREFNWIATPHSKGVFYPFVDVRYRMKSEAHAVFRIYNEDYLNDLEKSEREKILEGSSLLSFSSTKAPISISLPLEATFISTEETNTFSFLLDIEHVGSGSYSWRSKKKVNFEYESNGTASCDISGSVNIDGNRRIICRLFDIPSELEDIEMNFSVEYD